MRHIFLQADAGRMEELCAVGDNWERGGYVQDTEGGVYRPGDQAICD
jgi:hypothetical protein